MKPVLRISVIVLLSLAAVPVSAGTIFSANYNTTINAQVSGGSLVPTKVEDTGSSLGLIGLTTGGLGYGGTGEALKTPDPQDKVIYDHPFGPWNGGAAYVPNGRITVRLYVNNLPTGYTVNVFDLAPSDIDPVYEPWAVFVMRNANETGVPTMVEMLTADLWSSGSGYQYFSADVPGNPLSVNGWHTISTEWYQVTPGDMQHENIKIYFDGVLALQAQNVFMPSPYWMEQLYIGAYHNASANSIGQYGYIDDVSIVTLPVCGDPGTAYLQADLNQDCKVTIADFAIFAQTWMNCVDELNPACSGYVAPASPITIAAGPVTVDVSHSYITNFTIPAGQNTAYLAFDGRINSTSRDSFEPTVRYLINDHIINSARYMVNVPDARDMITPNGYNASWLGVSDGWTLPFSPDFTSFVGPSNPLELANRPYAMVLQIGDFVNSGTNKLELRYMNGADSTLQLVFQNVRLLFSYQRPAVDANLRDVPQVTGPVVPDTNPAVAFTKTIPGGGGVVVTVNGAQYNIESRYSYPNGTWNTLTSGSSATGEWAVGVAGNQVTATGSKYKVERTVNTYVDHIQVLDKVTNLTAQNLGLHFAHEVKIAKSALAKTYANGLRLPNKAGGYTGLYAGTGFNPTIYVAKTTSGVGLLARDDVFRSHVDFEMTDGAYGIEDSFFAVAAGANYTLKWEIYPTDTGSYYDFINAARRALQSNYLIPGNMIIAYGQQGNMASISDSDIINPVRCNNAKYVLLGGTTSKFDSAGNVTGSIEGPDLMTSAGQYTRYWLEQNIARYHSLVPGVKVLPYISSWYTTETNPATLYPNDWAQNPDGSQLTSFGMPVLFPTTGSTFGTALKASYDYLLSVADGFYMDESSIAMPIFSYRNDTWDNQSCLMDSSFAFNRKLTSSALYTLSYRLARFQDANAAGKSVWLNFGPVTDSESTLVLPRFAETDATDNCALVHLSSPIGFSSVSWERTEADIAASIRFRLIYGGLYIPTAVKYTTDKNIMQDLYPIKPIELHNGYIIGDTKIVTCVSGQFGFGDSSTLTVKIYDVTGHYQPGRKTTVAGGSQGNLANIQLNTGEMAIITK